jgi:streptogramin lyase
MGFALSELRYIVHRLSLLVVALLATGCASHGVAPEVAVQSNAPQIFQERGGGHWILISQIDIRGTAVPLLNWRGSAMTAVDDEGLTNITKAGIPSFEHGIWDFGPTPGALIGPDGNLWLSDLSIFVVLKNGQLGVYYPPRLNAGPITIGTDGAMWFGEIGNSPELGRITTGGVITEVPYQSSHGPNLWQYSMVTGADGNFWGLGDGLYIDRITQGGIVTSFTFLPSPNMPDFSSMLAGPDGAVWFIGLNSPNRFLVRMAMDGSATEYYPPQGPGPIAINFGPHGLLWMWTRVGTDYAIQSFDLATHTFSTPISAAPTDVPIWNVSSIAVGPDGNLWMGGTDPILVYLLQSLTVSPKSITLGMPGQTAVLSVSETNYAGSWSASSNDDAVATVVKGQSQGTFVVTATGVGHCKVTIGDKMQNYTKIPVTVH